ncbi:MAG: molybdopterin synthase sulfur carrier subunit [Dehalococcoidia bacterium]|nr:molybdopterin synthase sulfur carrier subunit [Dehalococcoidia bacterium]
MRLTVQYYALYRERTGVRYDVFDLKEDSLVSDMLTAVRTRYPHLAPATVNILVAVNEEYADKHQPLSSGDSIALIPPVSGGS